MTEADVALLACPLCRGQLTFEGTLARGHLHAGALSCGGCARTWSVADGLPQLVDESTIRGFEGLIRVVYDLIAPLHDPAVRYVLPLLQGSTEQAARAGYLRRLELKTLAPAGRPVRILEVGVGSGANLPLIEREMSRHRDTEVWGIDLSSCMLAQCRRRLVRRRDHAVRLLLADAHALPFPTASFDRVFYVGGIATCRDPARVLVEMARVARPGTPIVVVDEQLDPEGKHGLYYWLMFRLLTLYDLAPCAPRAHLPAGSTDVTEEQVSRFYYCLTFRMPDAGSGASGRHPGPKPRPAAS